MFRSFVVALLVFVASVCSAALTVAQMDTLKVAFLADPLTAVSTDAQIAEAWNQTAASEWIVWRTSISADELRQAIVAGSTQLDALTGGKRDSLLYLASGNLDPSDAAVRAGLDDLCGSQNILKAAIQAAEKRAATRAEKALSVGTGSTASPATLGWEGYLTTQDVINTLSRP